MRNNILSDSKKNRQKKTPHTVKIAVKRLLVTTTAAITLFTNVLSTASAETELLQKVSPIKVEMIPQIEEEQSQLTIENTAGDVTDNQPAGEDPTLDDQATRENPATDNQPADDTPSDPAAEENTEADNMTDDQPTDTEPADETGTDKSPSEEILPEGDQQEGNQTEGDQQEGNQTEGDKKPDVDTEEPEDQDTFLQLTDETAGITVTIPVNELGETILPENLSLQVEYLEETPSFTAYLEDHFTESFTFETYQFSVIDQETNETVTFREPLEVTQNIGENTEENTVLYTLDLEAESYLETACTMEASDTQEGENALIFSMQTEQPYALVTIMEEQLAEETYTLIDPRYGIQVEIPSTAIPEGVDPYAIEVEVQELTQERKACIEQMLSKQYVSNFYFQGYDISLIDMDTEEKIQPVATIQVKIPFNISAIEQIDVFYINEEISAVEKMQAHLEENRQEPLLYAIQDRSQANEQEVITEPIRYAAFETTHFSEYAVAAEVAKKPGATNTSLENGSFEQPVLYNDGSGNSITEYKNVTPWYTSATDGKIELLWITPNGTSPHMRTPKTVTEGEITNPKLGEQFIELAANEKATLYQDIYVGTENNFVCEFFHRARKFGSNEDCVAVFLGPKQSIDPAKNTEENLDQFEQIINWLKTQGHYNYATHNKNQLTEPLTVYSLPFGVNGTFAGSDNIEICSMQKTEQYSEKWTVCFAKSDTSKWYDYTWQYAKPDNCSSMTMAITWNSNYTNNTTLGNLIDGISLKGVGSNEFISNGGFENPALANRGRVDANITNWKTTDKIQKLEYGKHSDGTYCTPTNGGAVTTTYQPNIYIADGKQAAELNANEVSTLYQYVKTAPGKNYEWGLYHRGRQGSDTMALIIGPRQDYDPMKPDQKGQDQMMRMAEWIKSEAEGDKNLGLDIKTFNEEGCSKKIILYSTKFAANGEFVNNSNPFSWKKDDTYTEEWNVWLMTSDQLDWNAYGDIAAAPDYSYSYTVPADSNESIFAFASIYSVGGISIGNMLDNVKFTEFYRVECYTTPSGSGTYTYTSDTDFTYHKNYIGYIEADNTFQVIAKENTGEGNHRKFLGARINGEFISVEQKDENGNPYWVKDENTGNYEYNSPAIERHYEVRLIFAAETVVYDVNGGDEYHFNPDDPNTSYEVPMGIQTINGDLLQEYISHPATKIDDDGWRFMGWKYAENGMIYGGTSGVHKIKYVGNNQEGELTDYLQIYDSPESMDIAYDNISSSTGITMIAQWRFRQTFIPQIKNPVTGSYESSQAGGTITVTPITGVDAEQYQADPNSQAYYVEYNTVMEAYAIEKEGYKFEGWYDKDGTLLSPGNTYRYTVNNRETNLAYARFTPLGEACIIKKHVIGNMGEHSRYFKVTVKLTDAGANKEYILDGLTLYPTPQADIQMGTTNPTLITTDDNGVGIVAVYLKHGDLLCIRSLPVNAIVNVIEDNYEQDGYQTSYIGLDNNNTVTIASKSVEVIIQNEKNVEIPTGIHTNLWTGLLFLLTAAALFLLFSHRRTPLT